MATKAELSWLQSMVPAAQYAQAWSSVPSSISLAQCIIESASATKGWGQSDLALQAHNYFGIKAHHLTAPDSYVEFPTWEFEDGKRVLEHARFERYADATDSFCDHARLLRTAPRYRGCMSSSGSPNQMAFCLQAAGYSTNPKYAQLLIDLMKQLDLYQYDTLPPSDPAKAQEVAAA